MTDLTIENYPVDVLIVGAGLAGLTAALKLKQKESSLNVVIVESSIEIGGQLIRQISGEIGGKWFTKDQYHMYKLLKDLQINVRRKHQVQPKYRRSWEIDNGKLSFMRIFEINRFINEIDVKCLNYASKCDGFSKSKIGNKTMENYISSKLFHHKSRDFIRLFVRLFSGTESENITVAEFMNICCSSGGFKNLIKLYTASSNKLLEFSSEELLEKFKHLLSHSKVVIFKERTILEILHYTNYALARDDRGNIYNASIVILAIPWNCIVNIKIFPPLPQEYRPFDHQISNKYYLTSFIASFSDNFWKRKNLSGSCLILKEPKMFTYEYKTRQLAGILLHENYDETYHYQMKMKLSILERLAECYGNEAKKPIFFSQKTFQQNFLAHLPLIVPWNRLICSSSCTATSYRGCFSGAVQSGLRATLQALLIIRPQNVNWHDIADIQRANVIHEKISWYRTIFIGWNLYDIIYYGIIGTVFGVMYKIRKRIL